MKYTKYSKTALLFLIVFLTSSCKDEGFGELSEKQVYLIGSGEPIEKETSFDQSINKTSISIYCSGMELPTSDIQLQLGIDETILEKHNSTLGDNDEKFTMLPSETYTKNGLVAKILSGNPYGLFNFEINTTNLDGYKTYAIPFRLIKSDPYPLNNKMSTLLYKLNLVNRFSGDYRMIGQIDGNTISSIKSIRAASANEVIIFTDNKSEIMTNYDYRITLKVNADNTVSISSKTLSVQQEGNNTYDTATETFSLNYSYTDPKTKTSKKIKESIVKEKIIIE